MISDDDLKKIKLFKDLTEEELNKVKDICDEEQYSKWDTIFSEESSSDKLYVLKKGMVAIEIQVSAEKAVNVYTVSHEGDSFGWSSLVEPYKFTAKARCIEDSTIIAIDGNKLKELISKDYRLGYIIMGKIAKVLSKRLQCTRLQLISLTYG